MKRLYKFIFLIPIIILGCKTRYTDEKIIDQSMNNLNMNIFSSEGIKLLSIESPFSNYEKENNIFTLKSTTINLFKDNETEYVITSDNSKLSNNNKLIELNGNVLVKTSIDKKDKLYSNSFLWNIENSEFLLIGNVKFINNSISLSSNKAILNKNKKIIEFFNPVEYKVNDTNYERGYEVNSQNAYYNFDTKSVIFRSREERVRSKIYF